MHVKHSKNHKSNSIYCEAPFSNWIETVSINVFALTMHIVGASFKLEYLYCLWTCSIESIIRKSKLSQLTNL